MRFRLGLMAIFVLSASASGQTWTAVVGGNWSTGANWAGGNPPASLPTTALTFNADGSVSYTATNDLGAFFLRSLTINSQGSGTIGIANAAGSSLNFAGTNPAITLRGPGPTLISGGALNFTTTTTIADASDAEAPSRLTITSALSGTGNLEISRSQGGFLSETVLNPSANTHTGTIVQRFGTLTLGSANALGTSSLAINTTGFGLDATGDLRASVATAISSPMTLTSGNLNVFTGADITIHSDLSGNGGIALGDGLNTSTTDLTLNGNNSYIGQTRVLGGTLTVTNTIASSRLTVGRFGTAVIGSATTFNSNRLNPLVNIDGGILNVVGNSTAGNNWSEDVTTLQIHGFSTIGIDGQSATSTGLNIDTMTRFLRGSLRVRGDALGAAPFGTAGSATIAVTNVGGNPISAALIGGGGAAGTTNISVLPFAVGSATLTGVGDSFVTVDGSGLRPLNTTTEYLNRLPTAPYLNSTTTNYRLTTPMTSITQPTTVNALSFVGGGVYNTSPINVTSGAILSTATAHAGPLAFGAAEAHVTSSNGSLVLGSITGTNGLTVAGTGEVVVTNTSALSGQITLNSGLLTLGGGGVLASGLAPLLAGGGLSVRGFTEVLTNPISVSSVGGSVQMRPIGSLAVGTSTVLTLSGNISGTGGLFDIDGGGGRVELTGSNGAFNGIWQVSSGTLAVESQSNLGTAAPVVLNGGTLAVTANISLQNRLVLNASSTIFANTGGEVALTSRLDGRTNSAGQTLLGATVAFEQPAVYRGATNIGVGGDSHAFGADVDVRGNSGRLLGTSSVTIQERGSLFVDNAARSAGVFTPRLSGFPVTLAGGQLNMSGGEAGSGSTETLGALTLAGNTSNQMNLRILTPGSPSPTFNFTSLTRQPGSTLVIDTTIASQTFLGVLGDAANGVGVVRFAQPPALINGILPGVFAKVGNSIGFLDHDIRLAVTPSSTVGGVFVRDLRLGDAGVVFNNYGGATSNAYFDDNLVSFPTNTRTINSLSIETGIVRINVGQTLTVASGMVAFQTISGFILAQDAAADAGNLASPAGVDLSIGRPRQSEGGETIPGIITLVANLQPGSGTLNFAGDRRMRLVADLSTVQRMNIHGGEIRFGTAPQNGTISPTMDLHVQDRGLFVVENVNVAIDELTGASTINYDGIGEMTVGSANGSSTFNGSIGIAAGATFR